MTDEQPETLDPAEEERIRLLLAGPTGAPAQIPAEVWLRLERALMEESTRREQATSAPDATAGQSRPTKSRVTKSRGRTAALFGLAAAAVLVVGGTVVSTLDLQGGGQGPAPVAAGAKTDSSGLVLASGTNYEPTTLAKQVKATFASLKGKLRQAPQATASAVAIAADALMPDALPAAKELPFLQGVTEFQGCLHKITQVSSTDEVTVLLVDIATMQGTVTAIVVLPADEMPASMGVNPSMEQIFVVTPGCSIKAHTEVDLDAS